MQSGKRQQRVGGDVIPAKVPPPPRTLGSASFFKRCTPLKALPLPISSSGFPDPVSSERIVALAVVGRSNSSKDAAFRPPLFFPPQSLQPPSPERRERGFFGGGGCKDNKPRLKGAVCEKKVSSVSLKNKQTKNPKTCLAADAANRYKGADKLREM